MFSMMGMSGGGRLTHAPRAAQQSVHLTGGSLRDLRAFFWLRAFSCSQAFSQPAHKQVPITALVKGLQKIDFHECQVESSEPREQKNSHGSFLLLNLFFKRERFAN